MIDIERIDAAMRFRQKAERRGKGRIASDSFVQKIDRLVEQFLRLLLRADAHAEQKCFSVSVKIECNQISSRRLFDRCFFVEGKFTF